MTEKNIYPFHNWVPVSDFEDVEINFGSWLAKINGVEIEITQPEMHLLASGGRIDHVRGQKPNHPKEVEERKKMKKLIERMNNRFMLDNESESGPYNREYVSEIKTRIRRKIGKIK